MKPTELDYQALLQAVKERKIVNLLSVIHLQETLPALKASTPNVAQEELKLIYELIDTTQLVRPYNDLLMGDIFTYAHGEKLQSPFVAHLISFDEFLSTAGGVNEQIKVIDETEVEKDTFTTLTRLAKDAYRDEIIKRFGNKQPTFEEFYGGLKMETIEKAITRTEHETKIQGLMENCKNRGLEEMLKIDSVCVYVGASLSYQYADIFGEIKAKKQRRLGDSADLRHAISASPADIFVTHDDEFAYWMGRIPDKPFQVLDHINKLVKMVS